MHEMTRLLSHLVEMELVMEIIFLDCREVLAIYDTYRVSYRHTGENVSNVYGHGPTLVDAAQVTTDNGSSNHNNYLPLPSKTDYIVIQHHNIFISFPGFQASILLCYLQSSFSRIDPSCGL